MAGRNKKVETANTGSDKEQEDFEFVEQEKAKVFGTRPKERDSDDEGFIHPPLEKEPVVIPLREMSDKELLEHAEKLGFYDEAETDPRLRKLDRKTLMDYIESYVEPEDLVYNPVEKDECRFDERTGWTLCPAKIREPILKKINELDDDKLKVYMADMDRIDLLNMARAVGWSSSKGTKKKLIQFIIDFANEEHDAYPAILIRRGTEEFPYAKKMLCALGESPKTADDMMTDEGFYELFVKRSTPQLNCGGGMRVDNISAYRPPLHLMGAEPYASCRMMERVKSKKHYENRLANINRDILHLNKKDNLDTQDIKRMESLSRSQRYVKNRLAKYPETGYQKCYCGELKCFMGERDIDAYMGYTGKRDKMSVVERLNREIEERFGGAGG